MYARLKKIIKALYLVDITTNLQRSMSFEQQMNVYFIVVGNEPYFKIITYFLHQNMILTGRVTHLPSHADSTGFLYLFFGTKY